MTTEETTSTEKPEKSEARQRANTNMDMKTTATTNSSQPKPTYAVNSNLLDPRLLERLPQKGRPATSNQPVTPKKGECGNIIFIT